MINASLETTTPTQNEPTTVSSKSEGSLRVTSRKKATPVKALLGGILLLFLVIALGSGIYLTQFTNFDLRQQAWLGEEKVEEKALDIITNDSKFAGFSKKENNLVVGTVTVLVTDLEKRFSIYHAPTAENINNQALWTTVAEEIVRDASLQDFASQEGYLPNIAQNFDPIKVNQARDYFETLGTNHISGEMITLWFYNTNEPAMGAQKASVIQKERMEAIHARITAGELTMKEAAEELKLMTEIEEIDPVWIGNLYHKFEHVDPDEAVFNDPKLNTALWDMETGETSNVLLGQDFTPTEAYDAYFSIVKITKKETQKESNSVQEVIEKVEVK